VKINSKPNNSEQRPEPKAESKNSEERKEHEHRATHRITSPLKNIGRMVKKPLIKEAVKEVTSGGIVYRINKAGVIEILLAQDSRDRWTILKATLRLEKSQVKLRSAKFAKRQIFKR
jgi:hypothetical protein